MKSFTKRGFETQKTNLFFPSVRYLEHSTSVTNLIRMVKQGGGALRPRSETGTQGSGVRCNPKVVYLSVVPMLDTFESLYGPRRGHVILYLDPAVLVDFFPWIHINPDWTAYGHCTTRSFSIDRLQQQIRTSRDTSVIEILVRHRIPLTPYVRYILVHPDDIANAISELQGTTYAQYLRVLQRRASYQETQMK